MYFSVQQVIVILSYFPLRPLRYTRKVVIVTLLQFMHKHKRLTPIPLDIPVICIMFITSTSELNFKVLHGFSPFLVTTERLIQPTFTICDINFVYQFAKTLVPIQKHAVLPPPHEPHPRNDHALLCLSPATP